MTRAAPLTILRFLTIAVVGVGLLSLGLHASAADSTGSERASENFGDASTTTAAPAITVKITNTNQVYYPATLKKGAKYKKPAILKTSTVFDAISEWKEIKKKKLTKKDAEYHLLLKKANDKFNSALTTVQAAGSYDIIAEDGAITCKGVTAKDVNQAVVDALP